MCSDDRPRELASDRPFALRCSLWQRFFLPKKIRLLDDYLVDGAYANMSYWSNAEVTVRSAPVWHLLCGSHGGLEERDRKQFPSLNFYLELGRGLHSVTPASQQWAPCLGCSVWAHQLKQVTHLQIMSVSSTLKYWSRMCYPPPHSSPLRGCTTRLCLTPGL